MTRLATVEKPALDGLNSVFDKIPTALARNLAAEVRRLAKERGLVYVDAGGKERIIDVKLRPRPLTAEQLAYARRVTRVTMAAMAKVATRYVKDEALQEVLPLTDDEASWARSIARHGAPFGGLIVGRLDSNAALSRSDWRETLKFFELNGVGIGGLDYVPTVEGIVSEVVLPCLQKFRGGIRLRPPPDLRQQLVRTLQAHALGLGVKGAPTIGFLEDKRDKGGTRELAQMTERFRAEGVRVVHVDPRSISVKDGKVSYRGGTLDVIYRDTEFCDLVAMKRKGADLKALEKGFREGRIISSLAGELDHKSLWEVFTDARFQAIFTSAEREVFKKHMLWTRLLRPTKTVNPEGKKIDLVDFAKKNASDLVLKPNRSYGGEGVVIGRDATKAEWDKALGEAIAEPGSCVVQVYGEVSREFFPELDASGKLRPKEHFVDCGFIQVGSGFGVLSRASTKKIVNIAAGGGIAAVLWRE
ncbi:MAG: hypothetical protein HYY84_09950 [Deltaproteobacteria bacterium]|nr:hypothetical protein [Deltaproteobacteria bacterium]